MRHLIDRMMATRQVRASAVRWADYAISHHGPGSLALLKAGLDEPMGATARRTLRLAIRMVEGRLHQKIWVATMPDAVPAGIAAAR